KEILWCAFLDMKQSPQLVRSLVERLALNPMLAIDFAKEQLIADTMGYRDFSGLGGEFKLLEQLLLKAIAESQVELYSIQFRPHLADSIGVDSITVSNIQSALRSLSKNKLFLNQKMVIIKSGMLFLKNKLQMKYNFFNLRFQFLLCV